MIRQIAIAVAFVFAACTSAAACAAVQAEEAGGNGDSTEVRDTFSDVFADQEFNRLQRILRPESTEPGYLERFFDWMFPDNGTSGSTSSRRTSSSGGFFSALGQFLYWLAWFLVVTVLSFVGWILVRSILRHLEDRAKFVESATPGVPEDALELSHPPGEFPADEYERRAVSLGQSGNYKSAIRELVLGSMSWIERAGLIRYRKGLTNRDYIRAVYRKQVERASLEHIVLDFERAYFGRRMPDANSFDLCLEHYRRAFAREEILVNS